MNNRILVIGSSGQIGTELVMTLREKFGEDMVVASDIRNSSYEVMNSGPFEILDVTNEVNLENVINKYQIKEVYLLAALLSAKAEKNIELAWNLNMQALLNILNLGRKNILKKIFWPSSIAVFGPSTPGILTPQKTIMEPSTVYGISKLAGERWCEYYFEKFNVDVRSLRYPGLIGWKSNAGGGTTDYAVEIFHKAINSDTYDCFLSKNTTLPMMYMEDAIRATTELMDAPIEDINIRSSYNVSGLSFNPYELAEEIKKIIPNFKINYKPDYRQKIADSWPQNIDDQYAQSDWNWKSRYNLSSMTNEMINNLKKK